MSCDCKTAVAGRRRKGPHHEGKCEMHLPELEPMEDFRARLYAVPRRDRHPSPLPGHPATRRALP